MSDHPPQRLYKYRPLDDDDQLEHARVLVTDGTVWMASPRSFNDPLEFAFTPLFSATPEEKRSFFLSTAAPALFPNATEEDIRIAADEFAQQDEDAMPTDTVAPLLQSRVENGFKERAGVLSLAASPKTVLMWSHYALHHRGICLELDTARLPGAPEKVEYETQRPNIPVFNATREDMRRLALTKAEFWSYENEWRIMQDGSGAQVCGPELVTAVILGAKIDEQREKQVRSWLASQTPAPKLKRAVLSSCDYSVDIVDA